MNKKTLYIDMDGTLVEFRHKNSTVIKDWQDKKIFENKKICNYLIGNIINFIKGSSDEIKEVYVITQVPETNFEIHCKHKRESYHKIKEIFNGEGIALKDLMFVNSGNYNDKVDFIIEKLDIKNSILIDDTHNLLSKFEEYGGTAFHISSFI